MTTLEAKLDDSYYEKEI